MRIPFADRLVAMSRHADCQELALRFGAAHTVAERCDACAPPFARSLMASAQTACLSVLARKSVKQALLSAPKSPKQGAHSCGPGLRLTQARMNDGS